MGLPFTTHSTHRDDRARHDPHNQWGDEWTVEWNGDRSWAGIAAVGYELVHKRGYSVDLLVRGAVAKGQQSLSLGVGFTWF